MPTSPVVRLRRDLRGRLAVAPIAQVALERLGLLLVGRRFDRGFKLAHPRFDLRQAGRGDIIGAGRDRQLELGFEMFFIAFAAERYTHRVAPASLTIVISTPLAHLAQGNSGEVLAALDVAHADPLEVGRPGRGSARGTRQRHRRCRALPFAWSTTPAESPSSNRSRMPSARATSSASSRAVHSANSLDPCPAAARWWSLPRATTAVSIGPGIGPAPAVEIDFGQNSLPPLAADMWRLNRNWNQLTITALSHWGETVLWLPDVIRALVASRSLA